jgi:hypothetical protein
MTIMDWAIVVVIFAALSIVLRLVIGEWMK